MRSAGHVASAASISFASMPCQALSASHGSQQPCQRDSAKSADLQQGLILRQQQGIGKQTTQRDTRQRAPQALQVVHRCAGPCLQVLPNTAIAAAARTSCTSVVGQLASALLGGCGELHICATEGSVAYFWAAMGCLAGSVPSCPVHTGKRCEPLLCGRQRVCRVSRLWLASELSSLKACVCLSAFECTCTWPFRC